MMLRSGGIIMLLYLNRDILECKSGSTAVLGNGTGRAFK